MGNIIVIIILTILVGLVVRSLWNQHKNHKSCTGDCTSCGSGSCKVDWDAIRKDIQEQK